MADVKISGLPASTTPLAGTEVLPIVQGGQTRQVTVANLTAGRAVSGASFIPTSSTIPTNGVYLPFANSVGIATNSTNAVSISSAQIVTLAKDATINTLTVGLGAGTQAQNAVLGTFALFTNTTGNFCTAVGYGALNVNGTANNNTGVGYNALGINTSGQNTAVGKNSLSTNVGNGNNTAVGHNSGLISTGGANQFFGFSSGSAVTTGASNVILGAYTGGGAPISATGSNFIVLSDGAANVRAYFNGSIAIFNGTISPVQATTAAAPAYVKGAIYFDTTLNKLRVGGATGWETITSA